MSFLSWACLGSGRGCIEAWLQFWLRECLLLRASWRHLECISSRKDKKKVSFYFIFIYIKLSFGLDDNLNSPNKKPKLDPHSTKDTPSEQLQSSSSELNETHNDMSTDHNEVQEQNEGPTPDIAEQVINWVWLDG